MNSLLLIGGRIIDPANDLDTIADLLILDGRVSAIGPEARKLAPSDAPKVDVRGMVVCPGLIDMHVHLREPGQTASETIATGTVAAARGGFTSVLAMPNTDPPVDNPTTVALIQDRAAKSAVVNVFVAGCITKNRAGEELAPIGSLRRAGVVAITDDGACVQNNELMRRALEYVRMFDIPVLDHCQDYSLSQDGVAHEGLWSMILGLRGWPAIAEEIIVARNILLAELTGAHVHCQHVTTAGSVRLIRGAKKRGVPITAEACAHHMVLTDAALAGSETFWQTDGQQTFAWRLYGEGGELPQWPAYDPNVKVNPPLRSAIDRIALIEAVADGTIDVIASDHAPHCDYENEVEFDIAPFGMIGLQTVFPLVLMELYHAGRMPLTKLIARLTVGPAKILALRKGTLSIGADGDVTVFDPNFEWTFEESVNASKSRNTPFLGWRLKGGVMMTVVGGRIVWQHPSMTSHL